MKPRSLEASDRTGIYRIVPSWSPVDDKDRLLTVELGDEQTKDMTPETTVGDTTGQNLPGDTSSRDARLFGRAPLRARLRRAVEGLSGSTRPRVILITGIAGIGKGAMCRWMASVAADKGYPVEHVSHRAQAENDLPDSLVDWDHSQASNGGTTGAEASHRVELPRIVILEEVEWGRDTLDWLNAFVDRGSADKELPALVVVTATQEVLPQRPVEQVQIAQLSDKSGVETVELGPMSDASMRQLVQARLPGADRREVQEVVERADGNPGYAHRLIRRLADEDSPTSEVTETPRGSLADAWKTGLEGFARQFGAQREDALRCLEMLAVFKHAVPISVWRTACSNAGVEWLSLIPRALVSAGLGTEIGDEPYVKLRNPMARDIMAVRARDGSRWETLHAACAEALEPVELEGERKKVRRMCRHLLESGNPERALPWLDRQTTLHAQAGEFEEARWCVGELKRACERLDRHVRDPWQLKWLLHRGWLNYFEGHIQAARQASADLIRRMDEHTPAEIGLEGWRLESVVAMEQGRVSRSWTAANRAIEFVDHLETPTYEAKLRDRRGRLLRHRGDFEAAAREFESALRLFEGSDRVDWIGGTHLALATVLTQQEHYRKAIEHLESAREMFADAGMRRQLVRCYLGYGSVARRRERWDEALQWHVRALRLGRQVGASRMEEVRYFLGYSLVGAEAYERAETHLLKVEKHVAKQEHISLLNRTRVGRLCCEVGLGKFEKARETMGEIIDSIDTSAGHYGELGFLFERAGRICLDSNQVGMADVLLMLAASQWQAIGRTDRRARVLGWVQTDSGK